MKTRIASVMLVCVFLATGIVGPALAEGGEPVIMSHQAQLVFDIQAHTVQVVDHMVVPAGVDNLRLGDALTVSSISGPKGTAVDPAEALSKAEDEHGSYQVIDLKACGFPKTLLGLRRTIRSSRNSEEDTWTSGPNLKHVKTWIGHTISPKTYFLMAN